ncbi:hypothetical protein [Geothrix fuzhouensis]|uniref:hypothetical protein n=1 Tax=Geothrix fuzhouensis TaxID=2966451 RepID=UPI002148C22C|nr:hypothetical protein [Geothrix fuzhouensis]
MKRAEAEKLLGGYATGTLTEEERRALFEAALEHQDVFDSLADEEALRELLADPAARAHVLAGLASRAEGGAPKVVPFWRRPGVIGAAAGVIMAATAGLAVLRSPETQVPLPAAKSAAIQATLPAPSAAVPVAPEAKATPPPVSITTIPAEKAAVSHRAVAVVAMESPASVAQAGAAPAGVPSAAGAVRMEAARQAEARDEMSRKAEAGGRNRAFAVTEVLSSAPEPTPAAALAPAEGSAPPRRAAAKAAAPPTPGLHAPQAPIWTLESLADGTTRLTVLAFREAQVVLLRRRAAGVEVLKPATAEDTGPWQFQLRLAPGDVLDLYVLDHPVADPARLPETGPVDGFRARIHPPAKK